MERAQSCILLGVARLPSDNALSPYIWDREHLIVTPTLDLSVGEQEEHLISDQNSIDEEGVVDTALHRHRAAQFPPDERR